MSEVEKRYFLCLSFKDVAKFSSLLSGPDFDVHWGLLMDQPNLGIGPIPYHPLRKLEIEVQYEFNQNQVHFCPCNGLPKTSSGSYHERLEYGFVVIEA